MKRAKSRALGVFVLAALVAVGLFGCTPGQKAPQYEDIAFGLLSASKLTYEETLEEVRDFRDQGLIDANTYEEIRAIAWDFFDAHQAASKALDAYYDMLEKGIADKTDLEEKVAIMQGFLADLLKIVNPILRKKGVLE